MLITHCFFCCKILGFSFFIRGANIYKSSVPAKKNCMLFYGTGKIRVSGKYNSRLALGSNRLLQQAFFLTSSYLLFHCHYFLRQSVFWFP